MGNHELRVHLDLLTFLILIDSSKRCVTVSDTALRRVNENQNGVIGERWRTEFPSSSLRKPTSELEGPSCATSRTQRTVPHHPAHNCFVGGRVRANVSQFSVFCWSPPSYSTEALAVPEQSAERPVHHPPACSFITLFSTHRQRRCRLNVIVFSPNFYLFCTHLCHESWIVG